METLVPSQTWTDVPTGRSLVLEETERGDTHIQFWVAAPDDGPSVLLTAQQTAELIAELAARLSLLGGALPLPGGAS